jgi:hypothetical protein
LRGLQGLRHLDAPGCAKITDAGLENLEGLPALEYVDFVFDLLGDASADSLAKIPALKRVEIGETWVTDNGIARLCESLPNLEILHIGPLTTDAGLAKLADAKKLKVLQGLKPYHLTETGLGHLQRLTGITNFNVVGADDAAIKQIAELPHAQVVTFNGCTASAAGLRPLAKLPRLETLNFGGSQGFGNDHLLVLSEFTHLKNLGVQGTSITDKGIGQLSKLKELQFLNVTQTALTAAGIDELHKALPKCEISWDGGVVPPSAAPIGVGRPH